jgi:hypothetical protein
MMIPVLFATLCLVPVQDQKFSIQPGFVIERGDAKPKAGLLKRIPKLIQIPILHNAIREESRLADIMNRARRVEHFGNRGTDGHEATHEINSNVRNAQGGMVNAFYLMDGNVAVLKEPGIRKSAVAAYVPASLRDYRFNTYVAGARDWDDRPLYLVDEWSAYINGCIVALDDAKSNRGRDNSDRACGCIDLGIYCVALAMAVEKQDPAYFKNEAQFLDFMNYQWGRAKEVFDQAAPLFPFDSQDVLLKNLRTSPDAEAMRQFIKTHLNGVWLSP